jgi:excinuclease ABC subunit A
MFYNNGKLGGKKMQNSIIIKGAREHNLKNINLEIPRDKLVVITGLSGSR